MGCDDFCIWPDGVLKLCHVLFAGISMAGVTLSTLIEDENGYLGHDLGVDNVNYFYVFTFWRVTTMIATICGFITLFLWCFRMEGPRKYLVLYIIIVYYAIMWLVAFMMMIFSILHLVNAVEWYKCKGQVRGCPTLSENKFFWMIVTAMISSIFTFIAYLLTVMVNVKYIKPPPAINNEVLERSRP